jgi:hypothetical protein
MAFCRGTDVRRERRGWFRHGGLAALLLTVGCETSLVAPPTGPSRDVQDLEVPATPPTSRPTTSAAQTSGPAAIPAPALTRLHGESLAIGVGAVFERRRLPAPRGIAQGAWVGSIDAPDRILLRTATGAGSYIETRTGRVLAQTPTRPVNVSVLADAATLAPLQGSPAKVLRLSDAHVITPTIDAGDASVQLQEFAADPERPRVLVLAKASRGKKLAGLLSSDLTSVRLEPTELSPEDDNFYWERQATGAFEFASNQKKTAGKAGTSFALPHDPGCIRERIDDAGTLQCLDYLPLNDRGGGPTTTFLDSGYFVIDGTQTTPQWDDWFVSNTGWVDGRLPSERLVPGARRCAVRQVRGSPPRVVFGCQEPALAGVWSPEGVSVVDLPKGRGHYGVAAAGWRGSDPIVPVFDHYTYKKPEQDPGQESATTMWLDIVTPRLFETEALRPLDQTGEFGVQAQTLAVDDRSRTIWLLDFARGSASIVERVTDCPGVLEEWQPDGANVTRYRHLACLARPLPGHLPSTALWSEILDLEARTSYRTSLRPVAWHSDGVIVLSAYPAIEGEGGAPTAEIFSVDLAHS